MTSGTQRGARTAPGASGYSSRRASPYPVCIGTRPPPPPKTPTATTQELEAKISAAPPHYAASRAPCPTPLCPILELTNKISSGPHSSSRPDGPYGTLLAPH